MKIGILTCMWKRPEVFRIFATGLNRLKDEFDIVTLSIGSEGKLSKNLCKEYKINYLEFNNKPLGAKFNAGMSIMKTFRPDYVMVMGSDDLISDKTFKTIYEYCLNGYDMIGFTDLWFYDLITKKLVYWPGYGNRGTKADSARKGEAIGLGRTLSAKILDKLSWQPWRSDINSGLDWWMYQYLKKMKLNKKIFSLKENNLFAVDLKSKENICHSMLYTCEKVDKSILKEHLSENEIKMIKKYVE